MSNDTNSTLGGLDDQIEDFAAAQKKRRRLLRDLLDWVGGQEGKLIAKPTRMGSSDSFVTSVSMRWIASEVYYAKDLPIFKEYKSEESGQISINSTTLAYLQQRKPDYRRQLPMALYLAMRPDHKFGPLIIVAYKDWVYDSDADEWGPDGRAMDSSLTYQSLDNSFKVVELDVRNTSYFALDGQHRLMAIQGLKSLLEYGRLEARKEDGTPTKVAKTRDEIEQYYVENSDRLGMKPERLQSLLNEEIGVEIIPAVQEGETYEEATSRLRNIFVDVNENAKRLEKGELTLLDENSGFRIVARTIMTTHELFKLGDSVRVNTKTTNVTENSSDYTSLQAIVEISRCYLAQKEDFSSWDLPMLDTRELGYLRPEDDEIEKALIELSEYFDALKTLPSHRKMIQGTPIKSLRSRGKQEDEENGQDNILFWPISQVALAKAIASLQEEQKIDINKIMNTIGRYEENGSLKLRSKFNPWFGVLCDPVGERLRTAKGYQDLCEDMLKYLLGGGMIDHAREELRKKFFQARQIGAEEDKERRAYNLSGKLTEYNDEFQLPNPWV